MIDSNSINKILGIKESYELPDRMMELLINNTTELFEKFLKLENDLSYDWFTDYFQEQHSNRDSLMQDFTPKELTKLIPMLEDKYNSVADVCCGTGGLTISAWNNNPNAFFYCEELSTRAFPLLLFNLAIRNINAIAVNKDVLKNEVYAIYKIENRQVIKLENMPKIESVDVVITNPPYSVKWKYDEKQADERFKEYGYPPTQYADYGFILHALSLIKENGKVCAILPHGVLFRGGKEAIIREKLIKNNRLISIVGLPDKLFRNTSIPICVYGYNYKGNVLFIDASEEYIKDGKQNKLTHDNLEKIATTYKNNINTDKYSHVAKSDEIERNNYNLNISRYVDKFEKEEVPDLIEVVQNISELDVEIHKTEKELIKMMKELTSSNPKIQAELKQATKIWEGSIENNNVQLRLEL